MNSGINVHVYPSRLTYESRILRITDTLIGFGIFQEIEVYGIGGKDLPSVESVDAKRTFFRVPYRIFNHSSGFVKKSLRTLLWSWDLFRILKDRPIACINAHSLSVLPLSAFIAYRTNAMLVYDAHELETETIGQIGLRRTVARWTERFFIRKADYVFVVSDAIADWYRERYQICRPTVIRNVPFTRSEKNFKDIRRKDFGLPLDSTVFIYQGGFSKGRGLERLLQIFSKVSSSHLVLMGDGDMRSVVQLFTDNFNNIHMIDAVSPDEVLSYSKLADVGICLTENNCLSHYFSLPNKVFEYLQAGLPILINPLYEQARIVEKYECGWVAPEQEQDLINLVRTITVADTIRLKANVDLAARELNWEVEQKMLVDAYQMSVVNI